MPSLRPRSDDTINSQRSSARASWMAYMYADIKQADETPANPIARCAFSFPIPRVELLSRGGERHILCRRSVPCAPDLYQDTVARFQTPSHVHRSISRGFHWKSIADPVSRH